MIPHPRTDKDTRTHFIFLLLTYLLATVEAIISIFVMDEVLHVCICGLFKVHYVRVVKGCGA